MNATQSTRAKLATRAIEQKLLDNSVERTKLRTMLLFVLHDINYPIRPDHRRWIEAYFAENPPAATQL